MRTLLRACAVAALLAGFTASAEAQLRGVAGAGVSFPVGNFADETGGAAKGGGGTVFLGAEWMPPGRLFGLRLEGDFNQFCTTFCDDTGGNLDVKWRLMNVNLNGMLEMPLGEGARIRPYALGGVGVYNYELRGDDVLDAGSKTKLGLNGGLGLNYNAGRVGIFAESRFHNVFATGKDIQYVPVTVGVRIGRK